jgi:hypothetical protein
VELGYAIACHKPIYYLGERLENVFHRHPLVVRVKDAEEIGKLLAQHIYRRISER